MVGEGGILRRQHHHHRHIIIIIHGGTVLSSISGILPSNYTGDTEFSITHCPLP